MKTALIQSPLVWEDAQANCKYFSEKINAISEVIDLIILPEMFSTGFSMTPEALAETMNGETVLWMRSVAQQKNAAITGSIIIAEDGNYYNRLLFVDPSGEIKTYDKRHLFTLSGEHQTYSPGSDKLIVEYKGWKICTLICYDLRFPVFSRNTDHYDLLIYVANWPKPRIQAWDILLKARAVENMSFVIGVNRTGKDGNGLEYVGHSQVIDALGNCISELTEKESIIIADLDKNATDELRVKLPFLDDRDYFTVN